MVLILEKRSNRTAKQKKETVMAAYQYVYVMNGLSKAYDKKKILENVTLSFLPGV